MTNTKHSQLPAISVIIPTRNRLASLRRTINSLLLQDLSPTEYEIIIIDDGSTDGTAEYLETLRPNIRVCSTPGIGPGRARNAGSALAKGNILVSTDDDCVPARDWLTSITHALSTRRTAAIGGAIINALPNDALATVHYEMNHFLASRLETDIEKSWYRATANFACLASVFRSHGGFDDRFFRGGEDREFVGRLINAGEKVLFCPSITVWHYHSFTFTSYMNHFFRLGQGSFVLFEVIAKEKRLTIPRLDAHIFFELLRTISSGHGILENSRRGALIVASQAAVVSGYAVAATLRVLTPQTRINQ